jgi:hypothetical protein
VEGGAIAAHPRRCAAAAVHIDFIQPDLSKLCPYRLSQNPESLGLQAVAISVGNSLDNEFPASVE